MDFAHSRAPRGPLRPLFPLYRFVFEKAGISAPEDLDDATLNARWNSGRALLRSRLHGVDERTYLGGGGFIFVGTK